MSHLREALRASLAAHIYGVELIDSSKIRALCSCGWQDLVVIPDEGPSVRTRDAHRRWEEHRLDCLIAVTEKATA